MLTLYEVSAFSGPGATLFQDYISEEKCPACAAAIRQKSPSNAHIWVGSGRRWADVLSSIDRLLLHERIVEMITAHNFTGFQAYPVKIERIEGKALAATIPPQYYLIEITGTVDIDPDEIDDVGGSICPICFYRHPGEDNPYRWSPKRRVPRLETWDGGDFAMTRNLRTAHKYCSKRFIDLASQQKWTNFVFGQSLPGIGLWEKSHRGSVALSYQDKSWYEKHSERVRAKHPDLFLPGEA